MIHEDVRKLEMWNTGASNKEQLFIQVARLLTDQRIINEPTELINLLNQRERAGSTMIDELLAAPHAQGQIIKNDTLVLIHLDHPIKHWDGQSDAQNFIFCCIRPDITKYNAQQVTTILKLAVSDKGKTALQKGVRDDVKKILDF